MKEFEIAEGGLKRVIAVRLHPGDDVLLSLEQLCREKNLKNGLILSAIGRMVRHFIILWNFRIKKLAMVTASL